MILDIYPHLLDQEMILVCLATLDPEKDIIPKKTKVKTTFLKPPFFVQYFNSYEEAKLNLPLRDWRGEEYLKISKGGVLPKVHFNC